MGIRMNASLLAAAGALCASAAVPRVDENTVSLVQNSASRLVTVTYTLTQAPGIVTVDFQTNYTDGAETKWASIGAANFCNVAGAVNRLVTETGTAQTITWRPDLAWAGYHIVNGLRASSRRGRRMRRRTTWRSISAAESRMRSSPAPKRFQAA